jgi:hypothetical protein
MAADLPAVLASIIGWRAAGDAEPFVMPIADDDVRARILQNH